MPTAGKKVHPTTVRKSAPKGSASAKTTRRNPPVDAWFDKTRHPLRASMLRVRRVIIASGERVTESVKWSTPTLSYNGDIASFIPQAKDPRG